MTPPPTVHLILQEWTFWTSIFGACDTHATALFTLATLASKRGLELDALDDPDVYQIGADRFCIVPLEVANLEQVNRIRQEIELRSGPLPVHVTRLGKRPSYPRNPPAP